MLDTDRLTHELVFKVFINLHTSSLQDTSFPYPYNRYDLSDPQPIS